MKTNWNQVGEIFTNALRQAPETRGEYISKECGGNIDLINEIESLISSHDSAKEFLESPAVYEVAETIAGDDSALKPGDSLKHYKILKRIGAGGMGEVYLAEDSKLERNVAIKVLNENFESGQSNLTRFFREAKAASALDHPNIMVIHEIGEHEGTHYIVSEYIKGETLARLLKKNDYALVQVVDIAIQIAGAIVAAHKMGIVHRDIKPDNIILRRDGIVKILDFGLVKKIQSDEASSIDYDARTRELVNTQEGMILGTAAYMSPEQARGQKVDSRTDIWSFGVVLYQLLTKTLPFSGDTTSDIIASILKSPVPSIGNFVSSIPEELEQVVTKAIQKDAGNRYQKAEELLGDLKRIHRKLETQTNTEPLNFRVSDSPNDHAVTDGKPTQVTADETEYESNEQRSFVSAAYTEVRAHPSYALLGLVGAALLTVAAYIGFTKLGEPSVQSNPFQDAKLEKLTYDGLAEKIAAISPDGKHAAYVLNKDGKQSIVLKQIEGTGSAVIIPPSENRYSGIAFTPDGNNIYYNVLKARGKASLFSIPTLGGSPRKILENAVSAVSFSPDGKSMVFLENEQTLMISNSDGSSPKLLANSRSDGGWGIQSWHPQNKKIASTTFSEHSRGSSLVEIDVETRKIKPIKSPPWGVIAGLSWDRTGNYLFITGQREEVGFFSQIWKLSYPDGIAERVTRDFSTYLGISLSSDGETLVSIKKHRLKNIWISNLKSPSRAKRLTLDVGREEGVAGVTFVPYGGVIYTALSNQGDFNLWSIDRNGNEKKQLTFDSVHDTLPEVSADGKTIVYSSYRSGAPKLWQIAITGSEPKRLNNTRAIEGHSNFTPDGKFLIFSQQDNDEYTIRKRNLTENTTVELSGAYSERPAISPNGKFFACLFDNEGKRERKRIAIIPIDGGEPLKILDFPDIVKQRFIRWGPEGKSLVYIRNDNGIGNLWKQSFEENAEPAQLTFFESLKIFEFDIDHDNGDIILSRGHDSNDMVKISGLN